MTRVAAVALVVLGLLWPAFAIDALADVGSVNPAGRHSAHYALGCREPGDVVKAANNIQPYRCRPINLRWVKVDNYDVRIGKIEMILVEHPFYGQVYVLRPQE